MATITTLGATDSGATSRTTINDNFTNLNAALVTKALDNLSAVAINAALVLATSDAFALGSTTKMWSDLFLASGAVINFNNGNLILTHSTGVLTNNGTFSANLFTAPNNSSGYGVYNTSAQLVSIGLLNSNNDMHFLPNIGSAGALINHTYFAFNGPTDFTFGGACCGGSLPISFVFNASSYNAFQINDGEIFRAVLSGLKIGGSASRATTEGTNQVVLFNGTAPIGTLANGVTLYSASGELRSMDAAGNSTLLSPHDHETNEWIFYSKSTVTGKVLRIDMERMMKTINEKLGGGFVHEYMETI